MLQLNQKCIHLLYIYMKFKASDVALDNTRRIAKNKVMERFQQESEESRWSNSFSAARWRFNCFNLLNEMVKEVDHNEFNWI